MAFNPRRSLPDQARWSSGVDTGLSWLPHFLWASSSAPLRSSRNVFETRIALDCALIGSVKLKRGGLLPSSKQRQLKPYVALA